jgi:TRAP-type C4-dicarboxylate transport system permease small subunit
MEGVKLLRQQPMAERISQRLDTYVKLFARAHKVLLGMLLMVMTLVTTVSVVSRNLGAAQEWADELARILLIWMVFLGAALVVEEGGHLSLRLVDAILPPKAVRIVNLSVQILSTIVFCYLIRFARALVAIGAGTSTTMLGIPWSYLYAAFFVSLILMILYHIGNTVRTIFTV